MRLCLQFAGCMLCYLNRPAEKKRVHLTHKKNRFLCVAYIVFSTRRLFSNEQNAIFNDRNRREITLHFMTFGRASERKTDKKECVGDAHDSSSLFFSSLKLLEKEEKKCCKLPLTDTATAMFVRTHTLCIVCLRCNTRNAFTGLSLLKSSIRKNDKLEASMENWKILNFFRRAVLKNHRKELCFRDVFSSSECVGFTFFSSAF
jgi:hypothetical protein